MLNNKGFTLIEVLMVVAILGVITAIVVPVGVNYYERSKNTTERIFTEKLTKLIDDYIGLNSSDFTLDKTNSNIVRKCSINTDAEDNCKEVKAYKVTNEITFANIINEGLIDENDFINPKDSKKCDKNAVIEVYRDEDEVNYFRYDLECISDANKNGGYVYNSVTFLNSGLDE